MGDSGNYPTVMMNAALVLALLAGLLHVYIWWLESVSFEKAGRKVFGVRAEDVPVVKPWAFNQGYYNLFLGILTIIGAARAWSGAESGLSWVDFGLLVMLGAALVLVISDRTKARAALIQGTLPALGLIALGLAHA